MRRIRILALAMGLLLGTLLFSSVFASVSPDRDTWFDPVNVGNHDGTPLRVEASGFPSCCQTDRGIIYLSWDMSSSSNPDPINTAVLTLTTVGTNWTTQGSVKLELYQANPFGEGDTANPGTVGSALSSLDLSLTNATAGQSVQFPSTTALVNYLQGTRSDNGLPGSGRAFLAVKFAATNPTAGLAPRIEFGDRNSVSPPDLNLLDASAVDFYSFRSGGTADMTMLGLGLLVAVGLLVGTGYTLAKRRRA